MNDDHSNTTPTARTLPAALQELQTEAVRALRAKHVEDMMERMRQKHEALMLKLMNQDVMADLIAEQGKEIDSLRAEMIQWRALAQEMTPGGSEFMAPDAVRAYYRQFKDNAHAAKVGKAKLSDGLRGAVRALEQAHAEAMTAVDKIDSQPTPVTSLRATFKLIQLDTANALAAARAALADPLPASSARAAGKGAAE